LFTGITPRTDNFYRYHPAVDEEALIAFTSDYSQQTDKPCTFNSVPCT